MAELEEEAEDGRRLRGKGRGSRFCILGREVWPQLCEAPTANRMNFILAYLVLLAGSGADQRFSKWSASACEDYLGLGKPRARQAIDELIAAGLVEMAEGSSRLMPQYRLPDISDDENPIFLPVQLVTGLGREQPILRRIRETGDAMLLRMLIDLYGLVEWDATYGVAISRLRSMASTPARKVAEAGVHALWATPAPEPRHIVANGTWCSIHKVGKAPKEGWEPFWERLHLLEKIGALWFEPWLFEGAGADAEPLFPVDFGVLYAHGGSDDVSRLSRMLMSIAERMTEEKEYLLERYANDLCVARAAHQQAPAIVGVAKLRVEPDTPGCRLAYKRRKDLIERHTAAYNGLLNDLADGIYDRPLGSPREDAA